MILLELEREKCCVFLGFEREKVMGLHGILSYSFLATYRITLKLNKPENNSLLR